MVDNPEISDCELSRRLGGDSDLVRKILGRFSENLPILIVRLSLAIKVCDANRAKSQITMLEEVAKSISASEVESELINLRTALNNVPAEQWEPLQSQVESIASNFREQLQHRFAITVEDMPGTIIV